MGDTPYNDNRYPGTRGYPGRKHREYSQNEVYGSQYDDQAFEKIYVHQTSSYKKDKDIQRQFKTVKKTSQNYGQFYSPRANNTLPPISPTRGSQTMREPPYHQRNYRDVTPRGAPSDSVVYLPGVKKLELKFSTGDNTFIMYPGRYGCDFSSYRDGRTDLAIPDIKELNFHIENFDGTTYNFTTVPKRYDH